MRLSSKAMALASGLLWGGCLLLVGLINLMYPSYGTDFLRGMSSIYPGFYHTRDFADVLMGTLYGLIDGAVAAWLFGWLYNAFAGHSQQSTVGRLDKAA